MMKLKTVAVALVLVRSRSLRREPGRAASRFRKVGLRRPDAAPSLSVAKPKSKAQPPLVTLENYVVEPPDLLIVEVLEALPGRPISGERLVRPDGKISLGFYGDVYVAGLTIPEVKEKIVRHLQKFLSDEALGLVDHRRNWQAGARSRDQASRS